jgi:hypothetical protein
MNRMVSLCPFHHDRHHAGAYSMSGDPSTPQGVRFERVDGHEIRLARSRVTAAARSPGPRYHGSICEPVDTDFFTINRNQSADP